LQITRRIFLKTMVALSLSGCGLLSSHDLLKEREFKYFIKSLLPLGQEKIETFQSELPSLLLKIGTSKKRELLETYTLFRNRYLKAYDKKTAFTTEDGEAVISEMLSDDRVSQMVNRALDSLYFMFLRSRTCDVISWGRPVSKTGFRCLYWEDYDKPVRVQDDK